MKFTGKWLNPKLEQEYRKACTEIVKNDLKNFKQHPVYAGFVGNDTRPYETAKAFYDYLIKNGFKIQWLIPLLINDLFGNPVLHQFNDKTIDRSISSGTLRFAKVISDLMKYNLNSLSTNNIIEIGSGYGGMALCFSIFKYIPINYSLVDIEPSLNIAKKYLSHFPQFSVDFNFINVDQEFELDKSYDLFISDYCISELDEEGCEFYLNNIVSRSGSCYITMNSESQRKKQIIDFCTKQYKSVKVLPEEPKTSRHNNLILIGKFGK